MIEFKNNNFYINGEEVFLFGGEIHYFRIPITDWEDRILKVKDAGGNLVSTYIPWIIHEDIQGDIDVTGKRKAENDLGHFLKLIKKHNMYCIVRPGPYIMSELQNEGLPQWVYDTYEDIIAKARYGNVHPSKSVYLLHEGYLSMVDKWYCELGKVISPYMLDNDGPVIMAQLDNEIGMMHWCSGTADYSFKNIEGLRKYIIDKYGQKLCIEYPVDFEDGFYDFVYDPPKELASKLRIDLSLYMREYFKKYFEVLKFMFNKYIGDVPVIVNVHGFDTIDIVKRGKQYPIGVAQLSRVCDVENTVMAGDYYIGNIVYDNFQDIILANAFTYAVQSKGQPLFSAEFQGGFQVDTPKMQPTTYDLTTRLCVANGMNAINYYMFAGGANVKGTDLLGLRHSWQAPVDTDGSLNPHYKLISHLGHIFKAAGKSLLRTAQETVVHLGIIPEYYMTEYSDEFTQDICNELKQYREVLLYEGMGKGMAVMNIAFEGYDLTDDSAIDIQKVPKLAVFSTRYMDPNIQIKLIDFVDNGGKLLIFPTIPVMDLEGRPCTIIKDALECEANINDFGFAKYIDDVENLIIFNSTDFGNVENVFAMHEDDKNIGFVKELGLGMIVAFGVGMSHDYFYRDKVILNIFEKIDVKPIFTSDEKLSIISRVSKFKERYLFIINIDEYDKKTRIYQGGEALFEGKELVVKSRKGLMFPLNVRINEEIFIEYSTAEIYCINKDKEITTLIISIEQPVDTMIIQTNLTPIISITYKLEKLNKNRYKIYSNLHGYINDYIEIKFKES